MVADIMLDIEAGFSTNVKPEVALISRYGLFELYARR